MMFKEILGLVAVAMTFIAFLPYIRSIMQGKTKPHVFSWVIWGLTTFVIFLAQLSDGGGAGAWAIGVSGLITMYVAILAYQKHADTLITKVDWVFFIAALAAIPLWIITEDPLWTVIILTMIDVFGFAPTFRKSFYHPFDEQLGFYVLMASRNVVVVLALEYYSVITALFPALTGLLAFVFILMVMIRRKQMANWVL